MNPGGDSGKTEMSHTRGTSVLDYLYRIKEEQGAGFLTLLDPDRSPRGTVADHARRCRDEGVDAILVGTSLMMGNGFNEYVAEIREAVDIPVVIFPGEKGQVAEEADAILFLSLLSGRNPEFIVGEQVRSAPLIRSAGLEAISTAYLLIESGRMTSVEFMSNTKPLPSDKPEIAAAHAMVAEMFGMKLVYLEAGSGARRTVPDEIVKAVTGAVSLPVIAGGGIRTPGDVRAKIAAGASFVVVGNHLEDTSGRGDLADFVRAAHGG